MKIFNWFIPKTTSSERAKLMAEITVTHPELEGLREAINSVGGKVKELNNEHLSTIHQIELHVVEHLMFTKMINRFIVLNSIVLLVLLLVD